MFPKKKAPPKKAKKDSKKPAMSPAMAKIGSQMLDKC